MENVPQQNIKQKSPFLLIGGIIIISLVLIFTIFLLKKFQNKSLMINQQKNIFPSPTQFEIPSSKKFFKLSLPPLQKVFSLNDQINIDIYADSEGKNISGYDLIISYDPQGLEFVSAQSTLNDFSLYSFKKEGRLSLTGTKKLNSNNQTIFASTKIAILNFKPKKRGTHTVSLLSNLGKEKTQMVDEETKIYYPSLNQIKLEVR